MGSAPVRKPLRIIAWVFLIVANPAIYILSSLRSSVATLDLLLVVSVFGLLSVFVAVSWSKLFLQPSSRLSDWLSLLLFYGTVSVLLQMQLPPEADGIHKAHMLVLSLMITIWGAAWGWNYVAMFAAESFLKRVGLMAVGVMFVIGAPLAFWQTLLLVAFASMQPDLIVRLAENWLACVLITLPGILLERRARRWLAANEEHSG